MFNQETLKKLINESDKIFILVTKMGFSNLRLFKSKNKIYMDKLHFLVTVVNPDISLFDIAKLKIELAQFLNLKPEDLIILTDGSLAHPSEIIEKQFAITKENINEIKASLLEYKAEPEYQTEEFKP